MQEETILISLRIPKFMDRDIGFRVKSEGYASRTEFMREALREKLYKDLEGMRGALKGKVKVRGSMRAWRLKVWKAALRKAKGDPYKASEIMDMDEKKALKGLRL
ncbi:MAG: ribbon-helix-helix domain-containing protein [Candidatus Micrarchaeota archaeon]|nr:ribbon-helix-helix domain-containing protein [Candidatus Micrarchaeota archaeon]